MKINKISLSLLGIISYVTFVTNVSEATIYSCPDPQEILSFNGPSEKDAPFYKEGWRSLGSPTGNKSNINSTGKLNGTSIDTNYIMCKYIFNEEFVTFLRRKIENAETLCKNQEDQTFSCTN